MRTTHRPSTSPPTTSSSTSPRRPRSRDWRRSSGRSAASTATCLRPKTSGYRSSVAPISSLQSDVPDQQFIDGYFEAAVESLAWRTRWSSPVVPSLFTGGAAFPFNDWTVSTRGRGLPVAHPVGEPPGARVGFVHFTPRRPSEVLRRLERQRQPLARRPRSRSIAGSPATGAGDSQGRRQTETPVRRVGGVGIAWLPCRHARCRLDRRGRRRSRVRRRVLTTFAGAMGAVCRSADCCMGSRAPRPTPGWRWQPCGPTPAPRPCQRLPVSKNHQRAPWLPDTGRR